MTRTLATLLAVALGLFALGFALAALLSKQEPVREWNTQSNGRHAPIQDCPPTVRPLIPQGDGVAGAIDDWRERRWA